jgi:hypothetical protein
LNDVIALPPVVEDDWDAVLTEAKDAGIPVIIVDRSVSADKSLYAAHIGSDMVLEGKKAGEEMNKLLPDGGKIIELSGTTGSGAAVGRAKGFRETLNKNIEILDSQTGNFTTAEGKPVTIYQEVNLCTNLTVAENILLGREPRKFGVIDWKAMNDRADQLLRQLNINVDVTRPLSTY